MGNSDCGLRNADLVARYQVSAEFNLVKFRTDELKLSFLAYPEFESDPHPALRRAIMIDLATGKALERAEGWEGPGEKTGHRADLIRLHFTAPAWHP